jgi:hypothetical protein
MDWNDLKDEAGRLLFEKDALHIYAALLIQVMTAKLSGRTLGDKLPWMAVLAIELLNEAVDLMRGGEDQIKAWQVTGGIHDIINTMILPTVLLLLCRRAPYLFTRPDHGRENSSSEGDNV